MASVCVFAYSNNSFFERYAREYPHDGQDGLGALMGALEAAAMTLMGVFLCLLLAQYLLTPDIKAKGERGGQAS